MYAAIFHDSDGYTFSCETVLGIFDSRDKADELVLKLHQQNKKDNGEYGRGNLDNYEVRPIIINEPWWTARINESNN